MQIPIIDLSPLTQNSDGDQFSCNEKDVEHVTNQVFKAMSEVGFMYLKNHQIDPALIENAFKESEKFFRLPIDIKKLHLIDMTKHFRGYTAEGQQILNKDTSREFAERFSIECPDPTGTYQVPQVPHLVDALENLRKASQSVVRILFNLFAKALQLKDDQYFVKTYNDGKVCYDEAHPNRTMIRTHWYPKIPEDIPIPSGSVRCSEHKDWGIITLLFQDALGGLEVKSIEGNWIQATPIPNTILVNTGEILEWWTGNVFPATAHRVLIPESEIQKRTFRQSIAFFVNADNDTMISPLKSPLIDYSGHGMENFEPIRFNDHYQGRFNMTYKY